MTSIHNKVPFFDLNRLFLEQKAELETAALRALNSGWYILGSEGASFESAVEKFLGSTNSFIGCNSGTDALVLAMLAAGVTDGDEVIAPSHTAIPTISAIRQVGAVPKFADIDSETWLISEAEVFSQLTPKTRAVIAVHLYGNMVNIPALRSGLDRLGRSDVVIIEDVAQAFDSRWIGIQAGTFGDFGAFSFYPTKNLGALGDSGGVSTKNSAMKARIVAIKNYGQIQRYNAELTSGMNSRLDEVQAAILQKRLLRMNEWKVRKDRLVKIYRENLVGLGFKFQKVADECDPHWHLCVIKCPDGTSRDSIQSKLKELGVETLIHYPIPTHLQKAFQDFSRKLPVTECLAPQILSLPMNPCTTDSEVSYTIESLKTVLVNQR